MKKSRFHRRLLLVLGLWLWAMTAAAAEAQQWRASRLWPAKESTRLVIEAEQPIHYRVVQNRDQVVVELPQWSQAHPALNSLPERVQPQDVFIERISQEARKLVIHLKTPAQIHAFVMPPGPLYRHRLVIDVLPQSWQDPLMAWLEQQTPPQAAPSAPSSATRTSAPIRVMLDPGHGGEDPGAIGPGGSQEKNITLAIARKLMELLNADGRFVALLTREEDSFVALHHRVIKTRAARADVMISIHADAALNPQARGSSVFVLSESGASSVFARTLAKRENAADFVGGVASGVKDVQVARTLLELSQSFTRRDSQHLAAALLKHMKPVNSLHKKTVEHAGFAVLKAPDTPSVLVETAFLSHPEEEKRLVDPQFQQQLAQALKLGLEHYLDQSPAFKSRWMATSALRLSAGAASRSPVAGP